MDAASKIHSASSRYCTARGRPTFKQLRTAVWLTMQSAANWSPHQNREINREFCRIRPSTAIFVSDQDADSIAYSRIPYAAEQGISKDVSGKIFRGTGNFHHDRRSSGHFGGLGFSEVTARPAVHEPDSSSNLKPIFCKPASAVFPYSFSISLTKLGA